MALSVVSAIRKEALGLFMRKGLRFKSSQCSIFYSFDPKSGSQTSHAMSGMKGSNYGEPTYSLRQALPCTFEYGDRPAPQELVEVGLFELGSQKSLDEADKLIKYADKKKMQLSQMNIEYIIKKPSDEAAGPIEIVYA